MPEFTDLGSKPGAIGGESPKAPSVYYPRLSITSDQKIEFPKSGEAMIRFKKKDSGEREIDGKTQYHCELEVTGICPMGECAEEPMKKPKGKSFGEELDEVAAKKTETYEED